MRVAAGRGDENTRHLSLHGELRCHSHALFDLFGVHEGVRPCEVLLFPRTIADYHDFGELGDVGSQDQVDDRAVSDRHGLSDIAHGTEYQYSGIAGNFKAEIAVQVGYRARGGALDHDIHSGQSGIVVGRGNPSRYSALLQIYFFRNHIGRLRRKYVAAHEDIFVDSFEFEIRLPRYMTEQIAQGAVVEAGADPLAFIDHILIVGEIEISLTAYLPERLFQLYIFG